MASVRGPGARRTLFAGDQCAGQVPILRENCVGDKSPLVAAYRHLGVMQAPFGALGPELRHRIAQAHGAFQEGRRKIYKNRSITVRRKAFLLNATVLSKLLQGAGAWPPLNQKEQQMVDTAIWTFSRAILCIPRYGDQNMTREMCCALMGLFPPDVMLRRARLLYLRQLVASAPHQLWAVIRADRPYCELLLQDLTWLFLWNAGLIALEHPQQAWEPWAQLMVGSPRAFKSAVKRACALDLVRVSLIASLDGLHRGLRAIAGVLDSGTAAPVLTEYTEMCLPCKRAFRSRVAWSGHAARLHGYRCRSFLTGEGRVCRACGKLFSSVGRLRRHLTSVPFCLANWGVFVPAAEHSRDLHPQAPPSHVAGTIVGPPVLGEDPEVSDALLASLRAFSDDEPVDESEVWQRVQDFIEPLAVLRKSVAVWRSESGACAWKQEAADNVLLLLDLAVSAEVYPAEPVPPKPRAFTEPIWGPLRGLCLSYTGPPLRKELCSWFVRACGGPSRSFGIG